LLRLSDPIVVSAVAGGGATSAVIDLYTRRIPNVLVVAIIAAGLALAATGLGRVTTAQALLGFATGLAIMLPGHLIGATGAGDVKLFAALGTLLGPGPTVLAFIYTALAGGAIAIAVALHRRLLRDTLRRAAALLRTAGGNAGEIEAATVNRFAYAPAIAVGALAAALGF